MNAVLTQADLEAGLKELGLKRGDIVLLHSSLASMGRVEGGAVAVVEAFRRVLGREGTLVVPAFGDLGVIARTVENHPEAVKSVHPCAAVAAIGKQAAALCEGHWKAELAHGPGTPYARIAELGGYVLLLGVDQDRNTTLHTAEELLRLPYLTPTPEKTFETPAGTVTRSWPFFPGPHRDFIGIDPLLRASGKMKIGRIGNAVTRLIRSRDLIDLLVDEGRRNPAWALCDNPACADCVRQRATLRRARCAGESFRLAAGSRLAGRYVPEMIEALNAAGIGAVELDWIQGRPAAVLAEGDLDRITAELKAAGLAVSGLRALAVTGNEEALFDRAKAARIGRLILPLSHRVSIHAQQAAKRGLEASFFNAGMTAAVATELLATLPADGPAPRFTFDAAGFAAAGEKPFLESYKQKLRRFVDQLDVADALCDGTPAPLARGNAEIKEMVSILRCAGFAGWLVLSSGHPAGESLDKVCGRFAEMLERL